MTVKERRIDLRINHYGKWTPDEIEAACKTICQERERLAFEKTAQLGKELARMLPEGIESLESLFPESVEGYLESQNVYDAQSLRWVWDEQSPVDWEGSDADRAYKECMACAWELSLCHVIRQGN